MEERQEQDQGCVQTSVSGNSGAEAEEDCFDDLIGT